MTFTMSHPLRETLTQDDWKRIDQAFKTQNYDNVSLEEIQAANDVFLDEIINQHQTHPTTRSLQ